MKIAILGATSQIAQDLILSFQVNKDYIFSLFSRDVKMLEKWISDENLNDRFQAQEYVEFGTHQKYEVIINFVGAGDPAKIQKMGIDAFKVTEKYDNMALEYLRYHKKTKYIFLSSGAVYGGDYQSPVSHDTVSMVDINNVKPTDYYALAKLCAEIRHRSLSDLFIIDVRVFNYFSHRQDVKARFLITDIVRSIKNKEVLKTSAINIVRDFITPLDFYNTIQSIISFKPTNIALDCYTKSPVDKFDLLAELEKKFELRYKIDQAANIINATGAKVNYYSVDRSLRDMGYIPEHSSMGGVSAEINKHLNLF